MECHNLHKIVACADHPFFIWDDVIIPFMIHDTFGIQSPHISRSLHSKLTYSPKELKSKLSFFSTLHSFIPELKTQLPPGLTMPLNII